MSAEMKRQQVVGVPCAVSAHPHWSLVDVPLRVDFSASFRPSMTPHVLRDRRLPCYPLGSRHRTRSQLAGPTGNALSAVVAPTSRSPLAPRWRWKNKSSPFVDQDQPPRCGQQLDCRLLLHANRRRRPFASVQKYDRSLEAHANNTSESLNKACLCMLLKSEVVDDNGRWITQLNRLKDHRAAH